MDDSSSNVPEPEPKPEAELASLRASLAQAITERDEARAWARAEYHQMWDAPYVPDNAPQWLTAPM